MKSNEFSEWAKQFETPAKCLYPKNEGPHKVACRLPAHSRSPDDYPVCGTHVDIKIRPAWRGFVKGA